MSTTSTITSSTTTAAPTTATATMMNEQEKLLFNKLDEEYDDIQEEQVLTEDAYSLLFTSK